MYPSCALFSSLPPTIRAVLRSGARSTAASQLATSSWKSAGAGQSSTPLPNLTGTEANSSLTNASDTIITVRGWVKSVRGHKNVSFAAVTDGSTSEPLQAVFKGSLPAELTVGSSVELQGQLKASKGKGQDVEFVVEQSTVLGHCDAAEYPIQKKNLPTRVLRDHAHLRFRTTQMSAVMSLRDGMMRDWHDWFEENEFTHVHTPILTSSDCEGAGETFSLSSCGTGSSDVGSSRTGPETPSMSSTEPSKPLGQSQNNPGFLFPHPVNLTVSSQLHLEAPTHALGRTYTLSPCFRAEPSATSRHLAEFYMLEGEVAFVQTLDELLDIVEHSMKWTLNQLVHGTSERSSRMRANLAAIRRSREQAVADSLGEDEDSLLLLRDTMTDLEAAVDRPFARLDYTSAVIKLQHQHAHQSFAHEPTWGDGLSLEQEKWLAQDAGGPIFVTDYPASLKPFYMLPSNATGSSPSAAGNAAATEPGHSTVACFDLLLPHLGEIAGGSLREHRLPQLLSAIKKHGLSKEDYEWYLDLRRYGSVPHGGWGMGWDRWISWVSGVDNVKDVVAFPRWLGQCKY